MKTSAFLRLLILTLLLVHCGQIDYSKDPNTLATVDRRAISMQEFHDRFTDFKTRTGIPDNGMTRRQVLKGIVDEAVLISEAIRLGYDSDADGKKEKERVEIQELLNLYNREFIRKNVRITDEELQALFVRLNTKISARHLYSQTLAGADSLYIALQNGESFEKLAAATFNDPVLRESGGSLGYFSVDEMDPAFEDAAFSLKIGEISRPVRTTMGYSIIRVDDRILVKPIITETEYIQHRPKLETFWRQRKAVTATSQFVDSMRHALNVSFNEEAVSQIFEVLKKNADKFNNVERLLPFSELDEYKDKTVVTSRLGDWTVGRLQEFAKYTSDVQRGWIRNKENLKDYIAGLVVRSYILDDAKKAGINNSEDFKKNVAKSFDQYLLDRIEKTILADMPVPEDSLKYNYNANPSSFAVPPRIGLQEIVMTDGRKTKEVERQLRQGIPFEELARQYSINRRTAVNGGDMGYLTPQDLGKWAKMIFDIQVHSWIGPVKMDSLHVFLRCTDKIPAANRSFEEARLEIKERLISIWSDRYREQKLTEIRSMHKINSFPEKITTNFYN